jgi:AcrR family transcriptional regulator
MGITEATIFKYFAIKDGLYSAILDHKAEKQWLSELSDVIESESTFLRLLLYRALDRRNLSSPFLESVVLRLPEFLSGYFRSRIAEGRLRDCNPMLAARDFLGMVIHDLLLQEVFRFSRSVSTSEMVETFVDLFLQGIKDTGV